MESENDERPSLFQRLGFTQRHHSRPKAGATVQGPQDQYLALPNPDERADLRSSQLNDSDDETSPTLTAQQRRPTKKIIFKWEKRHIRALYVIKKHLQADWDKSTEIFNELFRNDIVSYGFRDGYGRQGLSAQYAERLKESPARHGKKYSIQTLKRKQPLNN
ncbi:hypothetical protein H2203_003467 [Taxawa tesnikishii (nom. ined.)]|nr:hypothetical protein H2203_003467 [Dothideales sp. JES 119]